MECFFWEKQFGITTSTHEEMGQYLFSTFKNWAFLQCSDARPGWSAEGGAP